VLFRANLDHAAISSARLSAQERPRPIIEQLNKELRSMIESEEMTKRIVADGGDPIASTSEEYAANIERKDGKWASLVTKLGLKIE
jgi:tripartite-type tricarboxylate transporter receptor subunit TctC